jgi:hypothetical protein
MMLHRGATGESRVPGWGKLMLEQHLLDTEQAAVALSAEHRLFRNWLHARPGGSGRGIARPLAVLVCAHYYTVRAVPSALGRDCSRPAHQRAP